MLRWAASEKRSHLDYYLNPHLDWSNETFTRSEESSGIVKATFSLTSARSFFQYLQNASKVVDVIVMWSGVTTERKIRHRCWGWCPNSILAKKIGTKTNDPILWIWSLNQLYIACICFLVIMFIKTRIAFTGSFNFT